jgi:hypothetical protein
VFACCDLGLLAIPNSHFEGQNIIWVQTELNVSGVLVAHMASRVVNAGLARHSLRSYHLRRVSCWAFSGLKECRAVDCESLCIVAGEKVWAVRVDVHVLDHCGNLFDAGEHPRSLALAAFISWQVRSTKPCGRSTKPCGCAHTEVLMRSHRGADALTPRCGVENRPQCT